jgi:cytochrome c oxidase cbb3-type subunit I
MPVANVHPDPAGERTRQSERSLESGNGASVLAQAAWHSLAWLAIANLIGVWIAILLLFPAAGNWIAPWSYGRWMPVHLNLQLYGWISLPLVGWLLHVYGADRKPFAAWSRTALLLWSLALTLGSLSWLNGHSSGKLFLDWTGYVRVFFPASILFLWGVLAWACTREWSSQQRSSRLQRVTRLLGLGLLFLIPFAIYFACNPAIYPPVNPDSGGPTGASQLESVLVIVLILFLLPYGITHRKPGRSRWLKTAWIVFAVEALLCLGLGRGDVSHHRPTQFLSLGSLLIWVPLMPAYYSAFVWSRNTRRWRLAVLGWWALLLPTGWLLFLPGILDRLKFTDGLVGHALMAMAGFVTSLLILVLAALLKEDGDVFDSTWAFYAWQVGTLVYVAIMIWAGWIEGKYPIFTMMPTGARNIIYGVRLVVGIAMTAASCNWLFQMTRRMRAPNKLSEVEANRPPWVSTTTAGVLR